MKRFLILTLAALLILTSCGNGQDVVQVDIPAPTVKLLSQSESPFYMVSEIATIKPVQEINLITKASGTLNQINKRVGDSIKKDDIIAVIDYDDANNVSRINLENARLQLANAQSGYNETLANNQASVDKAQVRYETVQNNLAKLERNFEELKATNNQSLASLELAVENAEKSYENAQAGLENTSGTYIESWDNFYKNAKTNFESVWVNSNSYLQYVNTVINNNNAHPIIWTSLPNYLGSRSQQQKIDTVNLYNEVWRAYEDKEDLFSNMPALDMNNIEEMLVEFKDYSEKIQSLVTAVRELIDNSSSNISFSEAQKTAARNQLAAHESSAINNVSSINTLKQTHENLKLNSTSSNITAVNSALVAKNTWEDAKNNLQKFKITSQANEKDMNVQIDNLKKDVASAKVDLDSSIRTRDIQNNAKNLEIQTFRNQVKLAERSLNDNRIVSSIDGILSEFNPDQGAYVSMGSSLGKVIQYQQIKVVFHVSKTVVKHLAINQPIIFTNESGEKFIGMIAKVSPMADPINKKFRIEAIAANPGLILKPETFVNVDIDLSKQVFEQGAIYVPLNTVMVGQNEQYVFVVNTEGITEIKPVKTGDLFGNWIELTEGVTLEDQIIVDGQRNLEGGEEVELQ